MRTNATYLGEELEVVFSCAWEKTDNGLDGPYCQTLYEVTDIQIEEITILGIPVKEKDLPEKLREAIDSLVDEVEFSYAEND